MLDLATAYSIDAGKQVDGVWFELGSDARIKVAAADNPRYTARVEELMKPYAHFRRRNKRLPDDIVEQILNTALAETVLIDWQNIEWANGKGKPAPLPYSRDNAIKVLAALPAFRSTVMDCAAQADQFAGDAADDQKKD